MKGKSIIAVFSQHGGQVSETRFFLNRRLFIFPLLEDTFLKYWQVIAGSPMGVPQGIEFGLDTLFMKFTSVTIPARRLDNSKKFLVY